MILFALQKYENPPNHQNFIQKKTKEGHLRTKLHFVIIEPNQQSHANKRQDKFNRNDNNVDHNG